MKKQNLPAAPQMLQRGAINFDIRSSALERWQPEIKASISDDNSISIFDPIGMDYWTGEGVTAKRIAATLRQIGDDNDVVVNINSPGGDMFEGLAIYNLLRNHGGKVTVKIMGIAASAASIIAMAGDEVQIARSGFLMIHNCWLVVIGNRHDLIAVADTIESFDLAMADIYASRSGINKDEIIKMMDGETYIVGNDAIDKGLADSLLPADQIQESKETNPSSVVRKIDSLLAKAQLPRSERRKLIQEFKSSMSCAAEGTPCATENTTQLNVTLGVATSITEEIKGFLK